MAPSEMYEKGNTAYNANNYSEAVKWFRKAAEQGYAKAQYILGLCFYYGEGVDKDVTEALNWFRKAAEQGDSEAAEMCTKIEEEQKPK